MTGADFAEWRVRLGLSLTEAATLLGVGRRTIMGYLKKDDYRLSSPSRAEPWLATSTSWRRTTCRRARSTGRLRERQHGFPGVVRANVPWVQIPAPSALKCGTQDILVLI